MKFGQSIEYNMKNRTQNVVEKLVLDLFLQAKIEHIPGSIV